jgi:serine/threonine protein kinase
MKGNAVHARPAACSTLAFMGNHYELLRKLGQGGMGAVYLARQKGDAGFERIVAFKKLSPDAVASGEMRELFEREIRLGARLIHPNVVQVLDGGLTGKEPYLTTEFVDGGDLENVLTTLRTMGGRLPPEAVAFVGSQVCNALGYMRSLTDDAGAPLIQAHRDISPGNVLVSRQGAVKLADFGVARLTTSQTSAAVVRGKWEYFAPEIATAEPDIRADLFALGLVLYQLATLKHPFEAPTGHGYWERASTVEPAIPTPEQMPPALWSVVQRALAKDPALRFQAPEEMGEALDGFLFGHGRPMSASSFGRLVAPLLPPPVPQSADPSFAIPLVLHQSFEMEGSWEASGPAMSADGKLDGAPTVPPEPRPPSPARPETLDPIGPTRVSVNTAGLRSLRDVQHLELHDAPLSPKPPAEPETLYESARMAPRFPLRWIIALVLLLGLSFLGYGAWHRGALRGQIPLAPAPSTGEELIRVDSVPTGAEVFEGETRLGITPLSFANTYAAGQHLTLTFKRKGYLPSQIDVEGGRALQLKVNMKKAR